MKTQKKSSKNAVTAGVFNCTLLCNIFSNWGNIYACPCFIFINAYACSTTCSTNLSYASCKAKSATAIVIAAILPSILLVATGHIPIAPLVAVPAGIIAMFIAKGGNYTDFKKNTISLYVFSSKLIWRILTNLGYERSIF